MIILDSYKRADLINKIDGLAKSLKKTPEFKLYTINTWDYEVC